MNSSVIRSDFQRLFGHLFWLCAKACGKKLATGSNTPGNYFGGVTTFASPTAAPDAHAAQQ